MTQLGVVGVLALMPAALAVALFLARRRIVGLLLTRTPDTLEMHDRRRNLNRGLGALIGFMSVIAVAGFGYAFAPEQARQGVLISAAVIAIGLNVTFIYFFRAAGLKWF